MKQVSGLRKFWNEHPLALALTLILVYVVGTGNLRNSVGDDSIFMTVWMVALTLSVVLLTIRLHAGQKLGLGPVRFGRRQLYLLALLPIPAVNLLAGLHASAPVSSLLCESVSMILVGFLEEVIMRGYLFEALRKDSLKEAVLITSLTFGIGHIVNLFTGQTTLSTLLQVGYALAIGLVFALVLVKTGSLWPCIFIHSLMDLLTVFAEQISSQQAALVSLLLMVYCLGLAWYLWKKVPGSVQTG